MENRDKKALELFKNGAVKRIDENKWQVKGSRVYTVKKLDSYAWNCNCKDHLFRFENCKHIRAAKLEDLQDVKEGFRHQDGFFNNKLKNLQMKQRAIKEQIQKVLNQNNEHMKKYGSKDDGLRKKHHRLHARLQDVEAELKKYQPTKTVFIG